MKRQSSSMGILFFIAGFSVVSLSGCSPEKVRARQEMVRTDAAKPMPLSAPKLIPPDKEKLKGFYPAGTQQVLEAAPTLILYSVNPAQEFESKDVFHEHKVLGKAVLTGDEKRLALDALYDTVSGYPDKKPRAIFGCFSPRHGIRVVDPQTGKRVDILVCFGCGTGYIYWNDGKRSEDDQENFSEFGPAANYYWNDLRKKHGLPIAP